MYREDGISAGDRSLEVVIDSIATLEKLYGFLTRLVLLTDTRQAMVSWRYRFMGSGCCFM